MEETANKQGITESKFHNGNTALNFPNADWEFGKECEECNEDCECKPQDDMQFEQEMSDAETRFTF